MDPLSSEITLYSLEYCICDKKTTELLTTELFTKMNYWKLNYWTSVLKNIQSIFIQSSLAKKSWPRVHLSKSWSSRVQLSKILRSTLPWVHCQKSSVCLKGLVVKSSKVQLSKVQLSSCLLSIPLYFSQTSIFSIVSDPTF